MKLTFKDPTAEDFDQEALSPELRKAVYKASALMGIILIIGLTITIYILCK
jgi:hypothetical protein